MIAPRFFLDVSSPHAYLAAERIERVLPVAPTWEPVLLDGIFEALGRSSWARTQARAEGVAEVERRAAAYGLPPIAWPDPWPGDGLTAMRAACAAAAIGGQDAVRAYLLAALRIAFRDGRDLAEPATIRAAAAAAGLDGDTLLAAAGEPAADAALRASTAAALAVGAIGVPAVVVGAEVFWGDDRLEDAAAAARTASATAQD